MSKARDIADLVSAGGILADGAIATTEITGVTATSAELNILDGVTATASELNYNDITTLGTSEASKVLTADSSGNVTMNGVSRLYFGDGGAAMFGDDNDLVISSSNAGTSIKHNNTGNLSIWNSEPDSDVIISADNGLGNGLGSDYFRADGSTGSAILYHYGNEKVATTLTGINVTGTADMDTLSIGGTAVTSTAAELNILDGVTSTAVELNILDGVTSTAAELNILDGVTATTAELNILDGVTATATELNILDGVTATATELNILDGVTATTTEINYVDGVTSNIQTQIDGLGSGAAFTAF